MKKIILPFIGITLLLLTTGCDDGSITTSEVIDSCSEISGTYSGTYNDNSCHGGQTSGNISNFTVSDGCSAEIQGFILDANGSISNIQGDGASFDVRVETPPGSTCGGLSGTCVKTGDKSYNCSYLWDQGGNGGITVRKH